MRTYSFLLVLTAFFLFGCTSAHIKENKNNAAHEVNSGPVGTLLTSKNFEFIANTMYPMGQPSKNLVGDGYSVRFSPERIISDLPYYGVAHRGMGVGPDKGMRFRGAPMDFSISQTNKAHLVSAIVKTDEDTFSLSMEVSESGYATLVINSKNRESISYYGEVK